MNVKGAIDTFVSFVPFLRLYLLFRANSLLSYFLLCQIIVINSLAATPIYRKRALIFKIFIIQSGKTYVKKRAVSFLDSVGDCAFRRLSFLVSLEHSRQFRLPFVIFGFSMRLRASLVVISGFSRQLCVPLFVITQSTVGHLQGIHTSDPLSNRSLLFKKQ